MITVFVVDDHQIFRDGVRMLLESTDDIRVVGESASGEEALEDLERIHPGLILMDIHMQGMNGIDATRALKERDSERKILMLSMFEDEQSVFSAMRAGAIGYLLKGVSHGEMLRSVRLAAAGGAIFSPQVANHILQWFSGAHIQPTGPSESDSDALPDLTVRERDVLELLAEGYDNNTIADQLFVTEKTVRNYVSMLLKKLEVSDRRAAAEKARRAVPKADS